MFYCKLRLNSLKRRFQKWLKVAFEFLFAKNLPIDGFANGFWARLKWHTIKPVSCFWVIRNQFRILVKIRMQAQILTILYQLWKHWEIISIFPAWFLQELRTIFSLFVLRITFRLWQVSCSFYKGQACAQRGYGLASVAQPWRKG